MPLVRNVILLVYVLFHANGWFSTATTWDSDISSTHKSIEIGPVHILSPSPSRTSYSWRVALDRTSGLAFSRETSNLLSSSKRHSTPVHSRKFSSLVFRTFESYPTWLCRGSVSFGLFKAVRNPEGGGYDVQTRWKKCNLLTFDRPQRYGHPFSWIFPSFSNVYTVKLPISGGLLAIMDTPRKGSLLFTLQMEKQLKRSCDGKWGTVITEIRSYRPAMCGRIKPTSSLRGRLYTGTQSLLHALVMYCFHRHIRRQISGGEIPK